MLAVENDAGIIAVDCGGDLVQRLLLAGCSLERLEALVVTHGHPDHVVGFPLVMQRLWLHGRRRPLAVLGPEAALDTARRLWAVFGMDAHEGMPRIEWQPLPAGPEIQPASLSTWNMWSVRAVHQPDTVAIRFRDPTGGRVVAYSSDTEPHPSIVAIAEGADILVHEATGAAPGHSSAADAARTAVQAGARRLLLVHLPRCGEIPQSAMAEARSLFAYTELGSECATYDPAADPAAEPISFNGPVRLTSGGR